MKKFLFLVALVSCLFSTGQTVTSTTLAGANALIYTPKGFDSTVAHAALIFFPGANETGVNAAALTVNGPFSYLKTGVDAGVNILVVAIQNVNPNPRPIELQTYLNALKAKYKLSKIVGTGLSRGGQDWDWFTMNAESQLMQVAGLAIASGEGPVSDQLGIPGTWTPSWFLKDGVKYWFAIGTNDPFYDGNKSRFNSLDPSVRTWTEWAGVGHGNPVWSDFYNPAWRDPALKVSLYQWVATVTGATQPPPPPVPVIPTVFKSIADSAAFARTNCSCGTPTTVIYTVTFGKYTSTVSQAAANALAHTDVTTNGQAYANANGICVPALVLTLQIYSDGSVIKIVNGTATSQ